VHKNIIALSSDTIQLHNPVIEKTNYELSVLIDKGPGLYDYNKRINFKGSRYVISYIYIFHFKIPLCEIQGFCE